MVETSFEEFIGFICEKLRLTPLEEEIQKGEVFLQLNQRVISLKKETSREMVKIETVLGVFKKPLREEILRELATSNYLGSATGGCTLSIDLENSILLRASTPSCISCSEHWEWIQHFLLVAEHWQEKVRGL